MVLSVADGFLSSGKISGTDEQQCHNSCKCMDVSHNFYRWSLAESLRPWLCIINSDTYIYKCLRSGSDLKQQWAPACFLTPGLLAPPLIKIMPLPEVWHLLAHPSSVSDRCTSRISPKLTLHSIRTVIRQLLRLYGSKRARSALPGHPGSGEVDEAKTLLHETEQEVPRRLKSFRGHHSHKLDP